MSSADFFKKIFTLTAIGLAVVLLEIAAIWWLRQKTQDKVAVLREKKLLIAGAEMERLEFAFLQRDYEKASPFLPKLEGALPEAINLFDVVSEINGLAEQTGNKQTLMVEGNAPQPAEASGLYFIPFSAKIQGSYPTIISYLRRLKRAPFFVRVESLDVSSATMLENESAASLTGKIFLKQ